MQTGFRFMDRAALVARRLAGYAADVLLLAASLAVLQAALYGLDWNWALRNPAGWSLHSWVLATVSLPCLIYFSMMPLVSGATPGQRAMGLRMAPVTGRFDPLALTARAAVLLLPFEVNHIGLFWGFDAAGNPTPLLWAAIGVTYGLAGLYVLSALISREGRAIHDWIGGVRVEGVAERP